jgi:cystathionine beta-lyase/cystathionine gamma-synthase
VTVPIYQTSTYAQDGLGKHKGYEYARTQNPTRSALEKNLAALEGAKFGFAFASGMAAIDATLRLVKAGEHVVVSDNTYGGTFRLFTKVLANYNIEFDFVDTSDALNVEAAIKPNTKMVFIETPTNPVMIVTDLKEVSEIAHRAGARVVCDNTFMSPYLQRPLDHGVDIVVHSTTKYLNGHSDVVGGAVMTSDDAIAERLHFLQKAAGAVPSPFDCYLVLRGLKTLGVRMRQHVQSARTIASFLASHPQVEKVFYPGLESHKGYALAQKQMSGPGGMISFELKGGLPASRAFLKALRVFACAESLGGVESLAEHPAIMTHASLPADARRALGKGDGLIRLSVGLEDVGDLRADLEAGFLAATSTH